MSRITRFSIINFKKLFEIVRQFIRYLRITTPSSSLLVESLSGGNQQKVVLAKWLAARCQILLLNEATQGIDVGAKVEIYHIMHNLVKKGCSIIFISSEISEILSLSDRILVMYEGKIKKELLPENTTQKEILKYSIQKIDK